tara:strand:- start:286 stop:501 length:216 start_codon:yes stop_codon:yes gene_type:complete
MQFMNVKRKIRMIDLLSSFFTLIMIFGMATILIEDDFQFFFNVRLIIFVTIMSIIGLLLNKKRQDLFSETL